MTVETISASLTICICHICSITTFQKQRQDWCSKPILQKEDGGLARHRLHLMGFLDITGSPSFQKKKNSSKFPDPLFSVYGPILKNRSSTPRKRIPILYMYANERIANILD
jgi:hypothetical protein